MAAVIYYLAIPFVYLVSWLPFPVLYLFSDFFYFVFYRLLGYRKEVVMENLRNSFPEKSKAELEKIRRDFYRYFCDLLLETFKTLTISREEMLRRVKFSPSALALFEGLAAKSQSSIMVLGHFGNWEWGGNTFSLVAKQQLYVIYHPLHNKYFDGLMYRMRTRFGAKLIPMKQAYREIVHKKDELCTTAFIADQTPRPDSAFWTTFLNQDTPVFKGTEMISRKLDQPVVFVTINRVKRGCYELNATMLCEHPGQTKEEELTRMHVQALEADIRRQPEIWLWSHRRWKHKRPQEIA